MSKARVVVLEVTSGHLSVTAGARAYGLSRQHIYRLLARFRQGGLEALDPRSRRPASNPRAVTDHDRNIPDELMIACAKTGGVVNINGIGIFLGNNDNSTQTFIDHIEYAVDLIGAAGHFAGRSGPLAMYGLPDGTTVPISPYSPFG